MAKTKEMLPSNNSKSTWDSNSKLGLWTGLGIPRSLLFLDPPKLNIKVIVGFVA